MFQAQVLYDFTAEPGNDELSVRQGETVTVIDQVRAVFILYECTRYTPRTNMYLLYRLWAEAGSQPRILADKLDWYLRDIYR